MMTANEKAELHFLRWFAINTDFGPADGDVQHFMRLDYTEETGQPVPEGWASEEDEDE